MIKNSTRGTSYTLQLPSTGYLSTEAFQQRWDTFLGHVLYFRVDKMGLLQAAKELLWGILSDLGHYLSIMTRKMNSVVKKGTCISNKIGDVINYKTRYMFFLILKFPNFSVIIFVKLVQYILKITCASSTMITYSNVYVCDNTTSRFCK